MPFKHSRRAFIALSISLFIGSAAHAVATLNITAGAVFMAANQFIVTTAITPTLVTGATNADFLAAFNSWNNEAGNPKGWTLVNGGTLPNGTIFDITTYTAKATGGTGSLEININYTPATGAPPIISSNANETLESNEAAWSQSIATTDKLPGSLPGNPYLDNPIGVGDFPPPLYPFQYLDSHFFDEPARGATNTWTGVAYLSTANFATQTLTIRDGVRYGFSVVAVPESNTLLLTLTGGASLIGAVIARRRKTA